MKKTFADYDIQLTSSCGHERTLCPACSASRKKSKEKCLSVNIDEGVWFCHHCGWHGSLKVKTSLQYKKPTYTPKPVSDPALKFFLDRKISKQVLAQNCIGIHDNAICFPYIKNGVVVNIKYRGRGKKFWQAKEAEPCLYRFDAISMLDGPLVITEGENDALAVQSAGWERVTSIPDGAINPESKSFASKFDFLTSSEKIIQSCKKIVIAMDNDAPGQAMSAELIRRIGSEKCWTVEYPEGCKDFNDVLVKYGADIVLDCINAAKPCPVKGLSTVSDYKKQVVERIFGDSFPRIKTGWSYLDQYYSPDPGLITIVTGMPSSGKSSFMDNLLLNLQKINGWRFAVFSPENWPIDRHISLLLQKMSGRKEKVMCEQDVYHGMDNLNKFLYFIYLRDEMLTVDNILAKARGALYRYGIKGLIIDPWNEVAHRYRGMTEAQYLEQSLSKVREFARTNQIHVWIVAHPRILHKDSNSGGYLPPTMYQINGGAQWRNKADFGLCIHRQRDKKNVTTVYIQKVRFLDYGKEGRVDMYVQPPGLFSEVQKEGIDQ